MSSSVEGVYTVKIDKVSELLLRDEENTKLHKAGSYQKMRYAKCGRFTLGGKEFEMRVCPWYGHLELFVCSVDNAGALKKYGICTLAQDHSAGSNWTIIYSIKLNHEQDFEFTRGPVNVSGLAIARAFSFIAQHLPKYCQDDCLLVKFVFWVHLDDSKVGAAKPLLQPDQKPNQPNNSPPDFIGILLSGQYSDIQFVVKEQTFAAHRAILAARSSVFQSELPALEVCHAWETKLRVSVQNMDALTFKHLLYFIYADSLPSDFEETTPPERYHLMFIAAHRFEIEGLKLICEEKLTKAVTDTIAITLKLNECGQEPVLLKIVPQDCHINSEIISTSTSVTKIGDRLLGTPVTE